MIGFILIWFLCGILAFRIDCRMMEQYEYEEEGFSGLFMLLLLGGLSLALSVLFVAFDKLNDFSEQEYFYNIKKKLYEFIVGKEPKQKNTEEDKQMLLLLAWIIVGYIAFILDENARHVLSDRDTKLRKSLKYVVLGYFGLGYVIGRYYRQGENYV